MNGILEYEGDECIFILDGNLLTVEKIKNVGKHLVNLDWFQTPPCFTGECLKGTNFINGKSVIIKTCHEKAGFSYTKFSVHVQYYIEYTDEISFSSMSIIGKELNYIFPMRKAIKHADIQEEGSASLETKPFSETTSDEYEFSLNSEKIRFFFSIYREICFDSTTPLTIYSCLNLKFSQTNDVDYIFNIWNIAYKVIQFLSNRRDVNISRISLYSTDKDGFRKKRGGAVYTKQKNNF